MYVMTYFELLLALCGPGAIPLPLIPLLPHLLLYLFGILPFFSLPYFMYILAFPSLPTLPE